MCVGSSLLDGQVCASGAAGGEEDADQVRERLEGPCRMLVIDSGLFGRDVFWSGHTRREDGSSMNRTRIVYHRVY